MSRRLTRFLFRAIGQLWDHWGLVIFSSNGRKLLPHTYLVSKSRKINVTCTLQKVSRSLVSFRTSALNAMIFLLFGTSFDHGSNIRSIEEYLTWPKWSRRLTINQIFIPRYWPTLGPLESGNIFSKWPKSSNDRKLLPHTYLVSKSWKINVTWTLVKFCAA